MKKCESWAVAAVFLMQSQNDSEHYTNIAKYVLETDITPLNEKGATAAPTLGEILRQKVIDGQGVFKAEGNGYYSLSNEDVIRKHEAVLYALQCLKRKNPRIDNMIADEESRQIRDEGRNMRDENKKLCDENKKLQEENQQLKEKLQSIKRLCD